VLVTKPFDSRTRVPVVGEAVAKPDVGTVEARVACDGERQWRDIAALLERVDRFEHHIDIGPQRMGGNEEGLEAIQIVIRRTQREILAAAAAWSRNAVDHADIAEIAFAVTVDGRQVHPCAHVRATPARPRHDPRALREVDAVPIADEAEARTRVAPGWIDRQAELEQRAQMFDRRRDERVRTACKQIRRHEGIADFRRDRRMPIAEQQRRAGADGQVDVEVPLRDSEAVLVVGAPIPVVEALGCPEHTVFAVERGHIPVDDDRIADRIRQRADT